MNKYVQRLYNEWVEHKKIIIAVDYDDTISPWKLNDQNTCDSVIKQLILAKNTGAYISIFTACRPDRFDEIKAYCYSKGLSIDSINTNPVELPYGNTNKIYANIFIDDRAGLDEALSTLGTARELYFNNFIALKDGDAPF